MNMSTKVCVTGGSGYIGSSLIKKLLEKGYVVHATLRNLEDTSKVNLLKSFPNGNTNLVLFEADIYNPDEFEKAIIGCEFVFHIATPLIHQPTKTTLYKDPVEAEVVGTKVIVETCIRSKSVKRLIYTASVMAASALNEDGISFKSSMDESCWTPLHLSFPFSNELLNYTKGKTLSEKEVLKYNDGDNVEVVSLACGLVGGETILSNVPLSVRTIFSQMEGNLESYSGLRLVEQLLGFIPMVHVDDVCNAHIFCMEKSSIKGRFLCAAMTTTKKIANYYSENFPDYKIEERFFREPEQEREIKLDNSKLTKMGFVYKYDLKKILDESLGIGKRLGAF